MKESIADWCSRHSTALISLLVTAIFCIRFLYVLPFSGNTRVFNYETVTSLASIFIYNSEPISFPLGTIKGLTFPFHDANIGNVGGMPLFALVFKFLGRVIPYFRTFDFFVLIELICCFVTAWFAQKILKSLGVLDRRMLAAGALLLGTSFLFLNRSAWLQAFCVASFPLFLAWTYGMLLTLSRSEARPSEDLLLLLVFPAAALLDNYTLVGLLLGTGVLTLRELFEAIFSGLSGSRNRTLRLASFCGAGVLLSLLSLYVIGMYPLPPIPAVFSSYDFGIGGRYHVADVFGPFLPIANEKYSFVVPSLPARLGFPVNTDRLAAGQYEGVGYIGLPLLLAFLALLCAEISALAHSSAVSFTSSKRRLCLYSPWKKVGVAAAFVFVFSLGYELHVYGESFPNFAAMPGAWLADRFGSLYNIRAPGRLVNFFSIFLMFEILRRISALVTKSGNRYKTLWLVPAALVAIHLAEISPFLKPLAHQKILPLGANFSEEDTIRLKAAANGKRAAIIGPSVLAADPKWTLDAFSLSFHLGIPSNLYYIARAFPEHYYTTTDDLSLLLEGNWNELNKKYGDVLLALPIELAEPLRKRVEKNYQETRVGNISIWTRIAGKESP